VTAGSLRCSTSGITRRPLKPQDSRSRRCRLRYRVGSRWSPRWR
jgi:hypothetical protein